MRPLLPDAACRQPAAREVFANLNKATVAVAKRICSGCPDRADCEDWAIKHENFGLWAGHTGSELDALRRERGIVLDEIRAGSIVDARPSANRAAPDPEAAAIRAWARDAGIQVPYRGPISTTVVAEYRQAVRANS